jgi:hypothetical protein
VCPDSKQSYRAPSIKISPQIDATPVTQDRTEEEIAAGRQYLDWELPENVQLAQLPSIKSGMPGLPGAMAVAYQPTNGWRGVDAGVHAGVHVMLRSTCAITCVRMRCAQSILRSKFLCLHTV